eukprot:CAMPEP_0117542720 /NCGR_PEP_ID=MMETSP0784-20121206/44694_1 /TAXON_ID=39447 /ORGANISM="" /LENGTH=486 /DNA_ID=CAMNT_0005339483 /DNA_START=125 /DNA_END=1585 /DNA_ORIENTATION=-
MGRRGRKPVGPQLGPQPPDEVDDEAAAARAGFEGRPGSLQGLGADISDAHSGQTASEDWWRSLAEDDPITLEPLANLPVPPFGLSSGIADSGATHYFDAVALASYTTRRAVFENPLTREPISREDCARLDDHIRFYAPGSRDFRVADALDLQRAIRVKRGGAGSSVDRSAAALRREATAALHGLFSFPTYSRQEVASSARMGQGLVVVDDDMQRHIEAEAIAALHAAAAAEAARPGGAVPEVSEANFPELSLEATLASERLAELVQEVDAFANVAKAAAAEAEREALRRAADERIRKAAAKEAAAQAEAARRSAMIQNLEAQRRQEALQAEAAERLADRRAEVRRQVQRQQEVKLQAAVEEQAVMVAVREAREAALATSQEEQQRRDEEESLAAKALLEEAELEQERRLKKEREDEKKRKLKEKQRLKKKQAAEEKARLEMEASKKAASLRCAMCGEGILGKQFFDVMDEKFCSTTCVKKRRAGTT